MKTFYKAPLSEDNPDSLRLGSRVVPYLVLGLLCLPLIIWFGRKSLCVHFNPEGDVGLVGFMLSLELAF